MPIEPINPEDPKALIPPADFRQQTGNQPYIPSNFSGQAPAEEEPIKGIKSGIPALNYRPPTESDPIPFDVDAYAQEAFAAADPYEVPDKLNDFARTLKYFVDPFLKQGFNATAALNRGMAGLYSHWDSVIDFIKISTGVDIEPDTLFDRLADMAEKDAERWAKAAEDVGGLGFMDTMISEAIGGFVPGVTQFAVDVGSGFTFPYMAGASQAYRNGEQPFISGMREAAKTAMLAELFKIMHPLKQYLKAPTMGTIFGFEEMEAAPEGKKAAGFAKGFGTGMAYSLASPGGRYGLNEAAKVSKQLAKDIVESGLLTARSLKGERGSVKRDPIAKNATAVPWMFENKAKPEIVGTGKNGKILSEDVYRKLSEDQKKYWEENGIDMSDWTPENQGRYAEMIAQEVEASYRSGGWGSKETDTYMQVDDAGKITAGARGWTEIITDPVAMSAWKMSLSLTSNGLRTWQNYNDAIKFYGEYRETGKFPEKGATGIRGKVINQAFARYNELLDSLGPERLYKFLNTDFTVSELKAMGLPTSGEKVTTTVRGSTVFGPKIGGAFFTNLMGDPNALTMDLWFMNSYARLTGDYVPGRETPRNATHRDWLRGAFDQAKEKLDRRGIFLDKNMIQAVQWGIEQDIARKSGVGVTATTDYADSAKRRAREEGLSDEEIDRRYSEQREFASTFAEGLLEEAEKSFSGKEKSAFVVGQTARDIRRGLSDPGTGRQSSPYSRTSNQNDRRDIGRQKAVEVIEYRLDQKILNKMGAAGIAAPKLLEVTDPNRGKVFAGLIKSAKKSMGAKGASVYEYSPEEYSAMRLFVTEDGMAGFALKGDDMVSGFNHGKSPHKRVTIPMLLHAIAEGGRRADSFDTILPYLYSDVGLKVVARVKWDEKEGSQIPGWDKKSMSDWNNGEPDVVYYVYDPDFYGVYKKGDGPISKSFEDAAKIQSDKLTELGEDVSPIRRAINRVAGAFPNVKEPRGSFSNKPKRERKFLKTISEAKEIDPSLREEVREVKPADYFVQPNSESFSGARQRIDKEGVDVLMDYLRSDAPVSAEKGALFHEMIKDAQKIGDYDRAIELIELYDTQGREAGRFIQTAATWTKLLSPTGFIRWADKQLEKVEGKYGWADTILRRKPEEFKLSKEEQEIVFEKFAEIEKMDNDLDRADATLELIDMVAAKVPPGVSELFDAYVYQNMLSGPKTQLRNMGENILNTFITRPLDIATRGAIDFAIAPLSGKEREAYVKDAATYLKVAFNSVPNAGRAFVESFKMSRGQTVGKPEIGIEASSEFGRARAAQLPKGLTVVGRFMEAADKFNMALIGAGEMAIQMKKGVPEAEAYARGQELAEKYLYRDTLKPGDPSLSLMSNALNSLGKLIEQSRKMPGVGRLSKLYVPFLKTPVNKAIQMVERSPLALARGEFTAESNAKIISGGIVVAMGALAAYMGETTWSAPTDKDEKELFYASGKKPYSVQLGNKWIPIWYLGPYAFAFGIPTAIKHYTEDDPTAITKDGLDKLLDIAQGSAQFIGSQSSTQSIGALFSAIHGDVDYSFSSQTSFTAQQIIPAGSLVRFINTIIDPVYRKPKGFIENIEKNLPVLSNRLNAHMTPYLEEATREPINYFLPYDVGTAVPEFEAQLPAVRYKARGKKIENAGRKVIQDFKDGNLSVEESMKKIMELSTEPQLESLIKFGEEIEKQEE